MPELPEVETIVRDLRGDLLGRRLASIAMGPRPLRRPWVAKWEQDLKGRRIREIRRRGKWILFVLDKEQYLIIHLGMTGQLRVMPTDEPLADHTHLVLSLDKGRQQLRFRDVRRFGSATVLAAREQVDNFFRSAGLGPEPFALEMDYWQARLAATRRCLKAVLLDQSVVAGVGNIYADEALFEARLHPARRASDLRSPEAKRLREAIVVVLRRAIHRRGSTIRNYVGGSGLKGQYQREFRVYGRTNEPCNRCGASITCVRLAGRSTHFCPACQRSAGNGQPRIAGSHRRLRSNRGQG